MNTQTDDTRRLPLWRDLLDKMIASGLEENKAWPLKFFTDGLSAPENSVQLAMGVHMILQGAAPFGLGAHLTRTERNPVRSGPAPPQRRRNAQDAERRADQFARRCDPRHEHTRLMRFRTMSGGAMRRSSKKWRSAPP